MLLLDSWSAGVLLGVPIVVLLLLIGVGATWFALTQVDDFDRPFLVGGGMLFLLVVLIGAAWGFYPYHAEYHKWHETSGKVAEISSRFLGNDKSTTQKFVVRFANGDERGCMDTRCALVKVGDTLTLTCKRKWQFAGRDGWDCNYIADHQSARSTAEPT